MDVLPDRIPEPADLERLAKVFQANEAWQDAVAVLEEATRLKPVVVIKSGRSKRGAVAAASHTGSLAGSDEVFDAIMRQCGVLRAESVQEAFNLCKFLSTASNPSGENVVIVTNGGGIGVLATDACEKYNVNLYDDNETLKSIFDDVTPGFGSTKNPIDLTGGATSPDFTGALDAALESDRIDAMARGLEACGARVEETRDSLTVRGLGPKGLPGGATVAARLDHRIAMSFLCLGMAAQEPVRLDDGAPVATSFPIFEPLMAGLGADIRRGA